MCLEAGDLLLLLPDWIGWVLLCQHSVALLGVIADSEYVDCMGNISLTLVYLELNGSLLEKYLTRR